MRQTVVGVFDRYAAAKNAAQTLQDSGFADSVFVTEAVEGDAPAATRDRGSDEGVMSHVRNFFSDLFGSGEDEKEVGQYAEAVRRGGAVVKVEVDEDRDVDAVREALVKAGAVDIEERVDEWRASGWEGASGTVATGSQMNLGESTQARAATDTETVIPVVEESLEVGKRRVSTGGVRVYARTVTTPVNESVQLESEHAQIERRPVSREATSADLSEFTDKTIEVQETAEKAVVGKSARVVEEVVVGKTVEQHTEQISDSVRSTEVEVEQLGAGRTAGGSTSDYETRFRQHFDQNYATGGDRYEDYQPAYAYGHTLANDQRYAGRSWDEVESEARRDWESRYPQSTWERVKAAVRHGWERVTS